MLHTSTSLSQGKLGKVQHILIHIINQLLCNCLHLPFRPAIASKSEKSRKKDYRESYEASSFGMIAMRSLMALKHTLDTLFFLKSIPA
jgi:hypothetical protein